MTPKTSITGCHVRALRPADLDAVVALDAELTGLEKAAYWRDVLARFLARRGGLALGVDREDGAPGLDGYLCGEVRAFEFGSEPCGWIFSLGVRPAAARHGIASALVTEARARFARSARSVIFVPVAAFAAFAASARSAALAHCATFASS